MKTAHLLLFILIAVMLAFCKKDYKCTCVTGKNFANSTPSRVVIMRDVTRKTAKANCISTIQTYSETCVLSN